MNAPPQWPELRTCEFLIEDLDELQWRQVKSVHVSGDDHVLPDAFQDDLHCVSTARAALVSAEEAYDHHVGTGKTGLAGTWSVSIGEITEASCRAIADHDCPDVETPGHSYVDMRGVGADLTRKEASKARKAARVLLATRATTRGRQHP